MHSFAAAPSSSSSRRRRSKSNRRARGGERGGGSRKVREWNAGKVRGACFKCGKPGHWANQCPGNGRGLQKQGGGWRSKKTERSVQDSRPASNIKIEDLDLSPGQRAVLGALITALFSGPSPESLAQAGGKGYAESAVAQKIPVRRRLGAPSEASGDAGASSTPTRRDRGPSRSR